MHAEEGKDSHDHNNQADEIDDSVHGWRSNICLWCDWNAALANFVPLRRRTMEGTSPNWAFSRSWLPPAPARCAGADPQSAQSDSLNVTDGFCPLWVWHVPR